MKISNLDLTLIFFLCAVRREFTILFLKIYLDGTISQNCVRLSCKTQFIELM